MESKDHKHQHHYNFGSSTECVQQRVNFPFVQHPIVIQENNNFIITTSTNMITQHDSGHQIQV